MKIYELIQIYAFSSLTPSGPKITFRDILELAHTAYKILKDLQQSITYVSSSRSPHPSVLR